MASPRSRRWRRIGVGVVLALGFVLAWCGFVFLTPPGEHQKVRLMDGTVIELLGYSFGKKHNLHDRLPVNNLHSLLALMRPPPTIRAVDTDRDALLLWVRIPHRNERWIGDYPPYFAAAKGADGSYYPRNTGDPVNVRYRIGNSYNTYTSMTAGKNMVGEEIMAIPILCYPQRDARFAVDLMREGDRHPLTTFQIANPNTTRPAPFIPEALPAVRKDQDLQATLEFVMPRPKRGQVGAAFEAPPPWESNDLQVTLDYVYRGRPDPNWKISELVAFDAMGNRAQNIAPAQTWPCRNFTPPSPGEAYKLRLGLQKTRQNRFDPEEIWTVQDVPLPMQGKSVPLHATFERDDLHLQLVSIYGMDGRKVSKDIAILRIKVDTPLENPILLPHVEDEQGHTIEGPWPSMKAVDPPDGVGVERGTLMQVHTGFIGDNDPHYRTIPLKIPKGTKHLNLSIKVPRIHFVEFTLPAPPHVSK